MEPGGCIRPGLDIVRWAMVGWEYMGLVTVMLSDANLTRSIIGTVSLEGWGGGHCGGWEEVTGYSIVREIVGVGCCCWL